MGDAYIWLYLYRKLQYTKKQPGIDKYYHSKANKEAASRSIGGRHASILLRYEHLSEHDQEIPQTHSVYQTTAT